MEWAASQHSARHAGPDRAFTLIELVVVMMLLAIAAALAVPHMASFFRGRVLASEARRILALTHYGQTRAVAEGVPVLLWVDAQHSTYGLITQSAVAEPDDRAQTFTTDSTLTLQAITTDAAASEDADERLGVPGNYPAIRFMPDGYFDDASISGIVVRQASEGALEIVPTQNRLGYEIIAAK